MNIEKISGIDGIITTEKLFDKAISLSRQRQLDATARKTLAIELLIEESQYFLADGKLKNALSVAKDILGKRLDCTKKVADIIYPILLTDLLQSIFDYNNNRKLTVMDDSAKQQEYAEIAEKLKEYVIPSLSCFNNNNSPIFTAIAHNYHGLAARNAGNKEEAKQAFVESIRNCQDMMQTRDKNEKGLFWLMYSSFNMGRLLINEGDHTQGTMLLRNSLNQRRMLYEQNAGKYENPNLFEGQYGKACTELAVQLLKQGNFDATGKKEEFEAMIAEADKIYSTERLDSSYTFRDYARMKILIFEHAVQHGTETTINPFVLSMKALTANLLPTAPAWKEEDLELFRKYARGAMQRELKSID
ncbi:hypothetical protein HZA96_06955 [Candidatus Woesearchaeota archaeon]|nr:hypothetical protein [Candidatus Woesearchaeota archaeon]